MLYATMHKHKHTLIKFDFKSIYGMTGLKCKYEVILFFILCCRDANISLVFQMDSSILDYSFIDYRSISL